MKNQINKNSPPKKESFAMLISNLGIGTSDKKPNSDINIVIKNAKECIKKSEELLTKSKALVAAVKLKI